MKTLRFLSASALLLAATLAPAAQAQDLAPPTGAVILTVTGPVAKTNAPGGALLDRDMLLALPQHSFATSTIWTEGVNTYDGVLLVDLLAALGAEGTGLVATALNEYQIGFPLAEATDQGPMLAHTVDGKPMTVRDKGPLWLIYPYDDVAEFRTEQTYARSIWQLDRIEITP
jgi:hypothetical protein